MSCIYNENFCRNYGTDICDHDRQESTEPECYKPVYGMGEDLYQEEVVRVRRKGKAGRNWRTSYGVIGE